MPDSPDRRDERPPEDLRRVGSVALAALFLRTTELTLDRFIAIITSARTLHAFELSFGLSLLAALVNSSSAGSWSVPSCATSLRAGGSSMPSSIFRSPCRWRSPASICST
jgi:hypothetical protein